MLNSMHEVAAQKGWNGKDCLIETGHYGPSFSLKNSTNYSIYIEVYAHRPPSENLKFEIGIKVCRAVLSFHFYKTYLYWIPFFNQSYRKLFHSFPIYKNHHPLSFIHVVLQNTALFWCWEIGR